MKSKAAERREMVKAGKIEDLRIFKLMFLEKSINEAKLLAERKTRACNDQIEQVKADRQSHVRGFELRVKTLTEDSARVRSMFEDEYGIKLSEWGYDDVTGVLVPLNPEVLKGIRSRETLQKGVDAERSEAKKKRTRRKIGKLGKKSTQTEGSTQPEAEGSAQPETGKPAQPEAENEESVQKPPATVAEA